MTTVKAFNEMMGQFLGELAQTFPEEPTVKEMLEVERTRETFDMFMKEVSPYSTALMQKDAAFFSPENQFVKRLNLDAIWKTEDATENTKNAIWQYLQTMFILGNTINMFPPETLSMIESAAEACAKNMKTQDNGAIDEQALMSGMNNMLAQMMAGGGGLQSLMQQPKPKPKLKGRKK